MLNEQTASGLRLLIRETEDEAYGQKYLRWTEFLKNVGQSEEYVVVLSSFLDRFPFNSHRWLQYVRLTSAESFRTALTRCPKSFELWQAYLQQGRGRLEPAQMKKELEKAIGEVGADSRALPFYTEYYPLIAESMRYEFYKKVFTRSLIDLESLWSSCQEWLDALPAEQLQSIYAKEAKGATAQLQVARSRLRQTLTAIYTPTLAHRSQRLALEAQIQHWYFDASPECREERQHWTQFITLERSYGIGENVSYCYQRRVMAQTDHLQAWEQAFHYLENETNKYTKALNMLRGNKAFFFRFNLPLCFYWCDLEERENPATARAMYCELEQTVAPIQVYIRHIQLEIREKDLGAARVLYDHMLTVFREDLSLLAYVLVQYHAFVIRFYKDFDYAKKLLKNYFDSLPYNDYLFVSYLELMKHFQNQEGFYDQLMTLILVGINKAKAALAEEPFADVVKMVKHYLRSTLTSIYLIKISQRKIFQSQVKNQI